MPKIRHRARDTAYNAAVGRNIRQLREGQRLTQADLAKAAGIRTQAQVGRYELGVLRITVATLRDIAEALGVDPATLLP